ncbi:hypothetical protein BpHYR1_054495 [Brachionus plicatilis]|uniref:Uncharacterized protein n=1 Tax=Brachionus plicatilis TaxID=10195 RepID=A0A3M7S7N1_BRAPC|nr:hypothetical protein BpHYR1_054495 [Brachionus plicatilis]
MDTKSQTKCSEILSLEWQMFEGTHRQKITRLNLENCCKLDRKYQNINFKEHLRKFERKIFQKINLKKRIRKFQMAKFIFYKLYYIKVVNMITFPLIFSHIEIAEISKRSGGET